MPTLSIGQFDIVYNSFSFAIAAMGAAFVFFILSRHTVAAEYQRVLLVGALIVGIAGYHYVRIFNSWSEAYVLSGGVYVATGVPFNEAYRYVDWLLTVPLLLVELIAVLSLSPQRRSSITLRLVIASALMIVLGFPGEVTLAIGPRLFWGAMSTIPFLYILYVLWRELGAMLTNESEQVRVLVRNLRLLLLASWGVYPIAYLLPLLNIDPALSLVGRQVGYSLADVVAKPAYGLLIYAIARVKTQLDQVEQFKAVPAEVAVRGAANRIGLPRLSVRGARCRRPAR
ncbi:bacteriorhodopsin [Candidatus Gracilibacteria bacterium]|nr:bacteriorhodopsin [Candidatus Gracilibacteria bacterium]